MPDPGRELGSWRPEALVDLLDGANDIVYLHDTEGRFLWLSQAVERHLGRAPAELVGAPIATVVHPEDLPKAEKHMRAKARGKAERTPPYELRLLDKDGGSHWFEISSRIVRPDDGTPFIHGTAREIGERRALRERVAQREAELRDWLERIPLGVYRTLPDGTILDGNQALCDIFGAKDLEQLKAVPATDLFVDVGDRNRQIQLQRAAAGEVILQDVRMKRLDGTPIWARDVGRAVVEDGEIQWLDGTLEDVTQAQRDAAAVDLLRDLALSMGGVQDLDDVLRTSIERIRAATGWSYGEAWTPAEGHSALVVRDVWSGDRPEFVQLHRLALQMRLQGADGLPGRASAEGRPLHEHLEAPETTFVRVGMARQLGLHAAVAVPVVRDDTCLAVLVFLNEAFSAEDEAWFRPLEAIARQLADVFLRARAEQRRQEAERLQRALVSSNPDAVMVVDAHGEVVDANERFLGLCGVRLRPDAEGPLAARVDRPERLMEALDHFYRVRAGDDVLEWRGKVLRRTRAPVTDAAGEVVARVWRFTEAPDDAVPAA